MSTIQPLLLTLGMLVSAADAPRRADADPAHLKEMLQDRQHPLSQSQAAILLVQSSSPDAEEIIRAALRQTDAPDVFLAVAAAVACIRTYDSPKKFSPP